MRPPGRVQQWGVDGKSKPNQGEERSVGQVEPTLTAGAKPKRVARSQSTGAPSRAPPDRLDKLEAQISQLVQALSLSGVLKPDVLPAAVAQNAAAGAEEDHEVEGCSDDLGELSDDHDGMQVDMGRAEGEGGKRPAADTDENPPKRLHTPAFTLRWYRLPVDKRVQSEVSWNRVRGDGNCFYRSMAILRKTGWQSMKKEVVARVPQLREAWRECFPIETEETWNEDTKNLGRDGYYANQMCVAAAATLTHTPILVISEDNAWAVCDSQVPPMEWTHMHVLRHTGSGAGAHFDPIDGWPPPWVAEMCSKLERSDQVQEMRGGGRGTPPFPIRTWNCGGILTNLAVVLSMVQGLVLVQETGLTLRTQRT
eukprot:4268165-Amphidinium_carterae.1